ncbi:hypothetical protein V5799_029029 [Amblyomma americanum]|uniref:RRM domain-containing protein n=1 Tax=Amblyomma americanum TaxID=6943 RepID=A0AAQ4ESB6_AMBAM
MEKYNGQTDLQSRKLKSHPNPVPLCETPLANGQTKMVSSRLANRLGVAGSPRRRPVMDARQILNARRATAAPATAARRLGLASRGIIKTGRAANLRLNTMRSDLVANAGGGGNGPLSNRIAPFGRRGLVTAAQTSPRFQARNLRQPVPGLGLVSQRRGLISGSRRLAALQQIQAAHMDIDERIPQARNKRIQVNPNGISVTTANPFLSRRQALLQGRRGESLLLDNDDDDDLERLTLDDVLGRSAAGAPAAARLYRSSTSGLARSPRASTSLSRIQHRLDGRGLDTSARQSPSEPLQGVSVLVSNLHPQVTESDVRDLFQDIGPMHDARMVGVSTALATFHRHADAMKAYKTYHGRLLDGQPMNLTVLTLDQLQSNQRGHPRRDSMNRWRGSNDDGMRGSLKGRQPGERLRKPKWDLSRLPPFQKDFYKEHPTTAHRPKHEVEAFRKQHDITIRGKDVPNPILTFEEANLPGI